jgi:hypothetical protein
MPVEIIGEFGTPGAEREWIAAEGKLAIRYIKKLCGDPPPDMRLVVEWQEHELGYYPVIALVWEDEMVGAPWNYLSRCEAALTAYENGGELPPGWVMPTVRDEDEDLEEEPFDPKKPPEPPDTLDLFEWQHSISKLIEWSLDYAAYQRNRPQLVETDDEADD